MKLSELSDVHLGLADRNILADVVVLIEGKEVGVATSKEVTEKGRTRLVLVPAKPRAPRSKSQSLNRALSLSDDYTKEVREDGNTNAATSGEDDEYTVS